MKNEQNIDIAIQNLARACKPLVDKMRRIIVISDKINKNPDFHLLAVWLKSKENAKAH